MHGFLAIGKSPRSVLDGVAEHHRQAGRTVQVVRCADDSAGIAVIGNEGPTLKSWHSGGRFVAAFGSSVERLTAEELKRQLDLGFRQRSISYSAGDLVAVSMAQDGTIMALVGQGPHRLFMRHLENGGSCVSTHLGTAAVTNVPAQLDRRSEDFLLGFGFLPDGRTIFEGVLTLPPATVMDASDLSQSVLDIDSPSVGIQGDTGSQLIDLLLTVTEQRTRGSDHHAVLLGGFDSALVCALLRRIGKNVTAFTFDLGDARLNQSKIGVVQKTLDIEHVWVPITPERIGNAIRNLTTCLNAPSAQPHYQLHTVLGAEDIAARGFDLALTGDGCDAAFLGYPTIRHRAELTQRFRRLPHWAARSGIAALGLPVMERRLGHVARVGRSLLRTRTLPWPASGHLPTQYLDKTSLGLLRLDSPPPALETVEETRERMAQGLEGKDPTRLAFMGNSATGASRHKVDGAIMHAGVAQWSPYQHPAVAELVNAMPPESLRPRTGPEASLGKHPLIEATLELGLLPRDVVLQPKQSPSASPIDSWYSNELRSLVFEMLEGLPFRWSRQYVEELLAPKAAENWYRSRVALSPHAFQAVGVLISYAAFASLSR